MKYLIILLVILIFTGCSDYKTERLSRAEKERMIRLMHADSTDIAISQNPPLFHKVPSRGISSYNKWRGQYGDSIAAIILAVNHIDAGNIDRTKTLIIPDTLTKNMLYYSPFPQAVQMLADIPKIFFVSQKIQAFAAYEYGVLVRWGPTSSGKKATPTPNGLFHTNWKAKETISTIDDEWLLKWNFNIDNFNGVSIHEYQMPGYPASHSCVRLLSIDAQWLYYWAQQWVVTEDQEKIVAYGTPVILFGEYDFESEQPWLSFDEMKISRGEITNLLSRYYYKIIQRQLKRYRVITEREELKKLEKVNQKK